MSRSRPNCRGATCGGVCSGCETLAVWAGTQRVSDADFYNLHDSFPASSRTYAHSCSLQFLKFSAFLQLTTSFCAAMPRGLPSPRYHQLYVHTNGEDDKEYNAKHDQAESLHGMVDEERVWGDMTVHDREMADRRLSRSQRVWSALTSIRSLLDTVLLLVILGLVLDRGSQKQSWFDVGGDITGFAPKSKSHRRHSLQRLLLTLSSVTADQVVCSGSHVYPHQWIRVLHRNSSIKMAEHRSTYVSISSHQREGRLIDES